MVWETCVWKMRKEKLKMYSIERRSSLESYTPFDKRVELWSTCLEPLTNK